MIVPGSPAKLRKKFSKYIILPIKILDTYIFREYFNVNY